jgi:hypothetical protein
MFVALEHQEGTSNSWLQILSVQLKIGSIVNVPHSIPKELE